jgi:hypothetical protein
MSTVSNANSNYYTAPIIGVVHGAVIGHCVFTSAFSNANSNYYTAPIIGVVHGAVIGHCVVTSALKTTKTYNRKNEKYLDSRSLSPPSPPSCVTQFLSNHPALTLIASTILGGVIFAKLPT